MGLFSKQQMEIIEAQAAKSNQLLEPTISKVSKSITSDLKAISAKVIEYFKDSKSELVTDELSLDRYIDKCIDVGYASIDCETTGLDRYKDTVVGFSLYYPGGVEIYIPCRHRIPIFESIRDNQLSWEQCSPYLQKLVDGKVKLVFANADFDLAMIYKDFGVDLTPSFYYDVILAWRCIKENEKNNQLKQLYHKYVLNGEGDPKSFTDFFPPSLFPYCDPEVAKLYAANDPKITYLLFLWQLPFITKTHDKCKENGFEQIADVVWNLEFPLVGICQKLHRVGVYLEKSMADQINRRYDPIYAEEMRKLHDMVESLSNDPKYISKLKKPWGRSTDFNPDSPKHVSYLLYDMMKLPTDKKRSTDKDILGEFNLPITKQILHCRSLAVLINTFIKKLPKEVWPTDGRIHCQFKSIGASTGRFSSAEPNMQNIPSKASDIRLMFRATPGYVLLSSDYSSQEPRLTAFCSNDDKMIQAFKDGKDIYASIGAIAFNMPYEECRETRPDGSYNPEGKKRRDSIKTVLLGACYGRSIQTIADQLYGNDKSLTDKEIFAKGQAVYDSVMFACPALRSFMLNAQAFAKQNGYVTTILGRRRHIPDMQLPKFEFKPMRGYINPDVDPMDPSTLSNIGEIPERIVQKLTEEFMGLKYFGQIVKRTRELHENDHIRVINNTRKISEAERKCVNSIIQGSAADQLKMAMIKIDQSPEWKELGGRLLLPVHDELIPEVPFENRERCATLLADLMCEAAEFLPFPSKCDVTVTYRWYGLEAPCKYPMPKSLDNMSTEEIRWVQYHLFETGYSLPLIGNKKELHGDDAMGVNGVWTDDCDVFLLDYITRSRIDKSDFIEHIHKKVHLGV